MWSIFFTMTFSGMLISTLTQDKHVWFVIFYVLMLVSVLGQAIYENKQKEQIEKLEKKIEELVGEDK